MRAKPGSMSYRSTMIMVSRVFYTAAGVVPDIAWRPRDRSMAKLTAGKRRPWITRREWLSIAEPAGFVAVFVENGWPKHVLYQVATKDEAQYLADADLARLTAPWPERQYLTRSVIGSQYWTVAPAAQGPPHL